MITSLAPLTVYTHRAQLLSNVTDPLGNIYRLLLSGFEAKDQYPECCEENKAKKKNCRSLPYPKSQISSYMATIGRIIHDSDVVPFVEPDNIHLKYVAGGYLVTCFRSKLVNGPFTVPESTLDSDNSSLRPFPVF